jgi:type IV pilus biogenesis protein CpaD/CtpE
MMSRALILLLVAAPAAVAEKAWIGDIPGCSREAAAAGRPLPFGCANALNLAAMVADPDDLRRGATMAPPRGPAATRAVERHRADKVPPLIPASGTDPAPAAAAPPQ